MDRGFVQQLFVFAAIFLLLQIGLDWAQGTTITPGLFLGRLISAIGATAIYGGIMLWLKKRKERGD